MMMRRSATRADTASLSATLINIDWPRLCLIFRTKMLIRAGCFGAGSAFAAAPEGREPDRRAISAARYWAPPEE